MNSRHLLDRTPIGSIAAAVCLSIAGLNAAGLILWRWVGRKVDAALTWAEPL